MSNVHLLALTLLLLTKSFWDLLKSLIKNSTSLSHCHTWTYSIVGHLGVHHFLELSWCCLFCSLGECGCFTSDSNWQLVGTMLTLDVLSECYEDLNVKLMETSHWWMLKPTLWSQANLSVPSAHWQLNQASSQGLYSGCAVFLPFCATVGGSDGKRICLQHRRPRFSSWGGKIPWRKEWRPTPVFLLGESHGQESLAGYHP